MSSVKCFLFQNHWFHERIFFTFVKILNSLTQFREISHGKEQKFSAADETPVVICEVFPLANQRAICLVFILLNIYPL